MSELPLVTALVCTYNYARYLPRTLDSALDQDYPPELLEIVVVDDGSTDATPEILANYQARFPRRIRSIRQANGGLAAATTRALTEARGELLAFLDADDVWPSAKTRAQVEILRSRPEVSLVYSDMELIDASDQVLAESWRDLNGQQRLEGDDCYHQLVCGGNPVVASSIMVRASLRERLLPMPRQPIFVDWWVAAQAAMIGELAIADTFRVGYRQHDTNTTLAVSGVDATMRERVRAGSTRRATMARGGSAVLALDRIGSAWALTEWDALQAVKKFGTAFVEFPHPDDVDRARSESLALRAERLARRGRHAESLRTWLAAAGLNPYNQAARTSVTRLAAQIEELPACADPLAPARSFAVLSALVQLEATPWLLSGFAAAFTDADSATLYVYSPGLSPAAIESRFEALLGRAGVDAEGGPDIVVQADPEAQVKPAALRAVADEVLNMESLPVLREHYEQAISVLTINARPQAVTSC